MKFVCLVLLSWWCWALSVDGFFQQSAKVSGGAKKSTLTQDAIDIFGSKFPFNQPPKRKTFLDKYVSLGVPQMDIDGTRYDKIGKGDGKRMTDITEKQAADTFNQIVSLYGEGRAIEMVKIFPICLAFNKSEFKNSFNAWSEIYGVEETKEM